MAYAERSNQFKEVTGPVSSNALTAAQYEAQRVPDFYRYERSVGDRYTALAKEANRVRKNYNLPPLDFELKAHPLKTTRPTVDSEEYANEEAHRVAETQRAVASRDNPGCVDWEVVNFHHLSPVVVDEKNRVILGNEHHGAAAVNGDSHILVLAPVGQGWGRVRNLRQAYDKLSTGRLSELAE